MKKILALNLIALFATVSAFADFIPGRVRPVAVAQMEVVEATGTFQGASQAMLYQNMEDGVGFVSLKLAMAGGKVVTRPVTHYKETGCGNMAWSDDLTLGDATINSEFTDYSQAICLMYVEKKWKLKVEMEDARGNRSVLRLEGNPETLYLTL